MTIELAIDPRPTWSIARRQFAVASIIFVLLGLVVFVLCWKDRQREWRLREEQSAHRLELAYELIARDLGRVKSDVLFVASQPSVRTFTPSDTLSRRACEQSFSDFLNTKGTYQQVRLIDRKGRETIRVDRLESGVQVVEEEQLQDKKDRYYVRESLTLNDGELFVSEFDLNQEHGVIERPLNPVIRFVTPVASTSTDRSPEGQQDVENVEQPKLEDSGEGTNFLLVANYKGAPLLKDLRLISLPGKTYLVRNDGKFLLGPEPQDGWGWLLGNNRSLAKQFPVAWKNRFLSPACRMTDSGAFAFRPFNPAVTEDGNSSNQLQNNLLIVSHLPVDKVFATSNQMLFRLSFLVAAAFVPILLLTRFWAQASFRRDSQNELIRESEQKLRELSTRLVKIQEEERRAISREIHDQLGQQATAISLDLKLALRETTDSKIRLQLERAISETAQLLEGLHDFATRIRPVELDDLGLVDALESHLWEFSQRSGIAVELDENVQAHHLPPEVCENAFRLVQESLNNVLKHANATHVEVALHVVDTENELDSDQLIISVQDDGVGLSDLSDGDQRPHNTQTRLGFLGMRERVDLLKGTVTIESQSGGGTTITAKIPVSKKR